MTAGHCVARASPRQVHVTLGDYVINSAVEPLPAYTFGVRKIDVHPYFKFTPQADRFDVSVLTLERPVHYMPHIGECRRGWQSDMTGLSLNLFLCFFSSVSLGFCSTDLFAGEERGFPGQIRLGCRMGCTQSWFSAATENIASRRRAGH